MNVNKRLDRFRQWGKEKMGGGGDRTEANEDFKSLEAEMNLRQEGETVLCSLSVSNVADFYRNGKAAVLHKRLCQNPKQARIWRRQG